MSAEEQTAHEDDFEHTFPSKPSELRGLSDNKLFETWRKMAYANRLAFGRMVEQEMTTRLIVALKGFKAAADRSARTLNFLTAVLVVLTVVLVIYTIRAG